MGATRDRLWGPAQVAAGAATVLTAGATEYIEIQLVTVSNPTGTPRNFSLSIGADAAGTRVIGMNASANIPGNTMVPFYGPFIVKPGEVVQINADVGAAIVCSGHGIRRAAG